MWEWTAKSGRMIRSVEVSRKCGASPPSPPSAARVTRVEEEVETEERRRLLVMTQGGCWQNKCDLTGKPMEQHNS